MAYCGKCYAMVGMVTSCIRMQAFGELEIRQLVLAGVLISGAITGGRCLVTILTDGQGKNGSTVAVSVVMVTGL